jgi:hypothetical protein
MPLIRTAPALQTWVCIDDVTDLCRDACWTVLMHGVAETSDAAALASRGFIERHEAGARR